MAMLNDEIKTEIVLRLAGFGRASDIAREIQAEFGVAVDRFQVRTYDPTKWAFAAGEKWRVMFDKARKAHLQDIEAVPISHKGYRLNQLQETLDRAKRMDNYVLANATLEQAAKEVGGALVTERETAFRAGVYAMSWQERRDAVAEIVRKAQERASEQAPA